MTIECTTMAATLAPCIRLNPCSNGMTIESLFFMVMAFSVACLNPCSNGMTIEFEEGYGLTTGELS